MKKSDWLLIFVQFLGVAGLFAGVGYTSHGNPVGYALLAGGVLGVGASYAGLRKG